MSTAFDEAMAAWSRLHGGYHPSGSRAVRAWLRAMYVVARPLAARRVPPDLLTALGVVCAAGAAAVAGVAGVVLVLATAVFDGLDGAVAIQSARLSAHGARLDRIADRVTDVLFAVALWHAGARAWVAVIAAASTLTFEAVRHRLTDGGAAGIGLVTVGERPFRIAAVMVGIVVVPTVLAVVLIAAAVVGIVQLASASPPRGTSDHLRHDRG